MVVYTQQLLSLVFGVLLFLVPVLSFAPLPRHRNTLAFLAKEKSSASVEDDEDFSVDAFQKAKQKLQQQPEDDVEFDGYALRDVILEKWGTCYDVDFNRVDAFGFKKIYLNVLPFQLGRRPFRHATEYDYLCHLQAVVEILQDYKQLDYVLYQMAETTKKPRPGTSPLVAVPIRLDLTSEQVNEIIG
jgi:hypothetical protein